jgi:hypothetical protein
VVSAEFDWLDRVSGTSRDGVYAGALLLPEGSEPGTWVLQGVTLHDALGNRRSVDLAQFLQMGFMNQFTVINRPVLRVTRLHQGILISWPVSAAGFVLQSSLEPSDPAGWSDVGLLPIALGREQGILRVPSATAEFYRLRASH